MRSGSWDTLERMVNTLGARSRGDRSRAVRGCSLRPAVSVRDTIPRDPLSPGSPHPGSCVGLPARRLLDGRDSAQPTEGGPASEIGTAAEVGTAAVAPIGTALTFVGLGEPALSLLLV
jgi:hypothetical protein